MMELEGSPARGSQSHRDRARWVQVIIPIVLVTVLGGAAFGNSARSPISGTAFEFFAVNRSVLRVYLKFTNTGDQTGQAQCEVHATDPSARYHGGDITVVKRPLDSGEVRYGYVDLKITGNGAKRITEVTTKDCKITI
jgi:hypothetical protein